MNYVWEVLLRAKELGMHEKDIVFRRAPSPSPYVEVAMDELNPVDIESIIDVNPFYRYSDIFQELVDGGLSDLPELETVLFDILIHFLGELDVLQGLCKKEYYGLFLKLDVTKEIYGKEYGNIIDVFPYKQRRIVTEHIVKLYSMGPSIELLHVLLGLLFESSLLYLDTVDGKKLLVYVGENETPSLKKQVQFILNLFMPIDYEIELFWHIHFGLISVDETMGINDFAIY